MKITLPYPPKELNPNSRVHYRKKNKASSMLKNAAFVLAKEKITPDWSALDHAVGYGHIILEITVHPPRKGRFDLDNATAALKPALDGIAMAWGVDDSLFAFSVWRGDVIKGGSVTVEVVS